MGPDDLIAARYKELQSQLIERKSLLTSFHHDVRTTEIQIRELEEAIATYDIWLGAKNANTPTAGR
jgi:hypothetical protein